MWELTGGVSPSKRLTLLVVVDGVHVHHVLGLWCQPSQSVVVPGRRQPLVLGAPTTRLLVAEAVTGDGGGRSDPVNGEGVGANVGEVQAGGSVQSCRDRRWRITVWFVSQGF